MVSDPVVSVLEFKDLQGTKWSYCLVWFVNRERRSTFFFPCGFKSSSAEMEECNKEKEREEMLQRVRRDKRVECSGWRLVPSVV